MSKSNRQQRDNDTRAGQRKAAALRYNVDKDNAPVIIASGYGAIADQIIDIAEESGIPVFKDDSAASMLCMLEVGRNIPEELYQVIAAVYMELMKISKDVKASEELKEKARRKRSSRTASTAAQGPE